MQGNRGKLILEAGQSVEKAKKVELYLFGRVMVVGLLLLLPHRHSQGSLLQRDSLVSVVGKGIQIKWLQLEHVIVSQCSLSSICRFSIQPSTVICINLVVPFMTQYPPPHIVKKITFLKENKLYLLKTEQTIISTGFDLIPWKPLPKPTSLFIG